MILDRYRIKLRRPAPDNFKGVNENLRELERWANLLPIPSVQVFDLTGGVPASFALSIEESHDFLTAQPNTVVCVDLFIDAVRGAPGFGTVFYFIYIDGQPIDPSNPTSYPATFNENAVRIGIFTGVKTVIPKAGKHTVELWTSTTINAGEAHFDNGSFRVWTF